MTQLPAKCIHFFINNIHFCPHFVTWFIQYLIQGKMGSDSGVSLKGYSDLIANLQQSLHCGQRRIKVHAMHAGFSNLEYARLVLVNAEQKWDFQLNGVSLGKLIPNVNLF